MHLPFTFATGEATLYQTGHPLHSFPESVPGKAEEGKEGPSDNLDPKSLLGALMSQDESVYVCQPNVESECSSFLGNTSLQAERWSSDPLLATLDSLSLDGDDPCSNTELFNALESLGLNAEDLELLLLLDERMIQVELDPNHVPTLSDLLTHNHNQALSYTHTTPENSPEQEEGDVGGCGVNAQPSASPPVIQLSQHASSPSSPPPVEIKGPTGLPNGHWASTNHVHQPHPVLTPSPLNSELKHLLESHQDQHLAHYGSHQQEPPLLGFPNQATITACCVPDGHASFLPSVEDVCHYQSVSQSSTLELEHLLGLSQSQHSRPAHHTFNTSEQGSAHSKVRRPHPADVSSGCRHV